MKKLRGFLLIETVIYSFIVAVFFSTLILMAHGLITMNTSLLQQIELNENAKFIQQKIIWAATGASTISTPAVNATSNNLVLTSSGSDTHTFDLDNGILRISTNGGAPLALTNSAVTVSNFIIENFSFSSSPERTLRVRATLTNHNATKQLITNLDFYFTTQ